MRYLLLCFLCLPALLHAQLPVAVTPENRVINVAGKTQYIEDPAGRVTIEDLLQKSDVPFQPVGNETVNFGLTASWFWLRTPVRNETDENLILELASTAVTDVWIYEVADNKVVAKQHSGNWQAFRDRPVDDAQYLFPLQVGRGNTATVYVRVRHLRGTQFPLLVGTQSAVYVRSEKRSIMEGAYYGFMLLMVLYNLFIYLSLRDPAYLYYVGYTFLMGFFNAMLNGYMFRFLYPSIPAINQYEDVVAGFMCMAGILFAKNFLGTRQNAPLYDKIFSGFLVAYAVVIVIILAGAFLVSTVIIEILSLLLVLVFFITAYAILRKGYKPARFFLIGWTFLLISVIVFILKDFQLVPYNQFTASSLQIGSAVEALLLSLALADRINVYKKETLLAQQNALRSLEENRKLITDQNVMLEKSVEERTRELKKANRELTTALGYLKETQEQLVQKEKMASLGELTAGIAHEIQNPLNFINNFTEVIREMLDELKTELAAGNPARAAEIAADLKQNVEKVLAHGFRADAIVKGMLQHSRLSSGSLAKANINALVNEYLQLAYQGLIAKDKTFSAILETHFDEHVGEVEVVPQDLGRVLLNIFNNAFYSVSEKKRRGQNGYEPKVLVNTKKDNDAVCISIRDNGLGIPQKVKEKIYQPFFTTKPAGEGTGLGLSLSYHIITKQHGGTLAVDTKEGDYAEFTVRLPIHSGNY